MGIFSWFGSRRHAGKHRARPNGGADLPEPGIPGPDLPDPVIPDPDLPDPDLPDPDLPPSLVRTNYETPELEEMHEAAAEDVARVREDDKYFGSDAPANQDEL